MGGNASKRGLSNMGFNPMTWFKDASPSPFSFMPQALSPLPGERDFESSSLLPWGEEGL